MSKRCEVEEEIYVHEHLWRSGTAITSRLNAEAETADAYHLLLPALLITYLAYEAFVNFCGHVLLPDLWAREKESFKGKSLEQKVEAIASNLRKFNWRKGERPYQSIQRLSALRDAIAHGKVQVNRFVAEQQPDGSHFTFAQTWDEHLKVELLARYREDVQAFCESLLVAMRQVSDYPHLCFRAFEGSLASGKSASRAG
jgi:hypothetical protein